MRLAIHVGAHIEQNTGRSSRRWQHFGQGRPVYPWQSSQNHLGQSHGGAGIAGGKKAGHFIVFDQAKADPHTAVRFLADSRGSLFVHGDPFRRRNNHNGELLATRRFLQRCAQLIFRADQVNAHRKVTASLDSALYLRLGSFIRAHRIEGNIREHGHRRG